MNAIASYRRSQLENAPNEDLLVMLLNEAVRREELVAEAISAGDRIGRIAHVHVARAIFMELRMALDVNTPPELAIPLRDTYAWCVQALTEVAHTGDLVRLAQIQKVTALLEDTWTRAVGLTRGEPGLLEEP